MSQVLSRRLRALIASIAGSAIVVTGVLGATAPASAAAEDVDFSFDFGGPTTPVAAGWLGVNPGTAYTAERGYGFTTAPASNGFRDRGGDDLVARDFTISSTSAFAVDVPNGTYEVTTWAGDLTASNATSFSVEGTLFSGPRTSTGVHPPAVLPDHHRGRRPAQRPGDGRGRPDQRHPRAVAPPRSDRACGERRCSR